jgi:hypothetical protein
MYNFSLEHHRDPNNMHVGDNTANKHTSSPAKQTGFIVGLNPVDYTADVQLSGVRNFRNQPVILYGVRVTTTSGGAGWGVHNLPLLGQLVELTFENGIATSSAKVSIGQRYYSPAHPAPNHPILHEDRSYHKAHFEMAEGGSFKMKHADGSVTEFKAKPHTAEGHSVKSRGTGVAQTASEARMDAASASRESASVKLKEVSNKAELIKGLAEETKELTAITSYVTTINKTGTIPPVV